MSLANNVVKPIVKVGMTIHKIAKFQPTDTTVKANLEIYFTYPEDQILGVFKKYSVEDDDEFKKNFKFPFLISNSIETNIDSEAHSKIKVEPGKNINYHNNINSNSTETITYRLEKYMINCELEIVNFTHLLPFNKIIVPINIITNGQPGTEEVFLLEEFKIFKCPDEIKIKNKIKKGVFIKIFEINKNYIFRFENDELNKKYGYYHVKFNNIDINLDKSSFEISNIINDETIELKPNYIMKIINTWPNEPAKTKDIINKILPPNNKLFKKTDIVWGKFIGKETEDRVYQRIENNFNGCNNISNKFYNKWDWYDIIHAVEKKHDVNSDNQGGYSRIYFLLSHSFSITEDIIKYYVIPMILTITIMLFYNIDSSSFSGLFPTIMLGNITLLFIQPETGKFTYNERSVHLNIAITIILSLLKISEVTIFFSQFWWIILIIITNLLNLLHNMTVSNYKMNQIDNVFKNENIITVEELFNGDDSKLSCNLFNCYCCTNNNLEDDTKYSDDDSEYSENYELTEFEEKDGIP